MSEAVLFPEIELDDRIWPRRWIKNSLLAGETAIILLVLSIA